jgi:hypothetical protein
MPIAYGVARALPIQQHKVEVGYAVTIGESCVRTLEAGFG